MKVKVLRRKDSGKCSMRTAMDVVKRVLWDEMIPQEFITIGLDYFTFGVPEHRIQYFKYKDVVVWDKRFRLDRVFGSSRSTKTIRDIIGKYEKYCKTSGDTPDIHFDKKSSEVSFHWDLESVDDNYLSENQTESSEEEMMPPKREQTPNFFICQRIESPDFIDKALKIQSQIYPKLFHLTLSTIRLEDSSQVSECMKALEHSEEDLCSSAPTNQLSIKGVDSFRGRVLYAAVESTTSLELFVNQLNTVLRQNGFQTDDRKFTPHISLVKVTRSVSKKVGAKKLDTDLYNEFINMEFGTFLIDSIHLCAIGKPYGDNGFYRTVGSINFTHSVSKPK
ncbi:unnamed protein product [Heterobilharzia americana]|nr:unnamed protein product [Heterobilharzia americana]